MFRSAYVPDHGLYPEHQHAWAEFVYSFSGVMEVKVLGHHYWRRPSTASGCRRTWSTWV